MLNLVGDPQIVSIVHIVDVIPIEKRRFIIEYSVQRVPVLGARALIVGYLGKLVKWICSFETKTAIW